MKLFFISGKKMILTGMCCIFFLSSMAQLRLGVKGGISFSEFDVSSGQGIVPDYTAYARFHVGFLLDIPVNKKLSIQPEILFSSKGTKNKVSSTLGIPASSGYINTNVIIDSKINPLYIELPVYLKGRFEASPYGHIIAGIGPYIAIGISGKEKATLTINSNDPVYGTFEGTAETKLFEKDNVHFNINGQKYEKSVVDYALMKRFDAGISGFAGYEFSFGLFATIGYDMGLYDINNSDDNEKLYNQTLYISAGYKF